MKNDPGIRAQVPIYGINYRKGDVGFTSTDTSFVTAGIAYFTRRDCKTRIHVSHTFFVTGPERCIEATMPRVREGEFLGEYFRAPHTHVFFRRLRVWTPEFAEAVIAEAEQHIGERYGFALLLAHAFVGTALGNALNKATRGWLEKRCAAALDNKKQHICSEFVAEMLLEVRPFLEDWPCCLQRPPNTINPQELFEDNKLFDPWADASNFGMKG